MAHRLRTASTTRLTWPASPPERANVFEPEGPKMILPPMAPGSTQAPRFALRSIDRQTLIAGLAVLAIGIWLRSATIGRESLWLDEIYSVSLANLSIPGTLMAVLHFDVHPPLYYLQLNLWERM